jgi:hypothetical protein
MGLILVWAPWISFACLGVSTALWVWSAFTPIRNAIDYFVADMQRAARRNAAASLFAAIAFFVQAVAYGVPAWVADTVL